MEKNEKTTKKKEKRKFNIYKLFTVLLAAILLVIVGYMLRNWIVERNAQKQYEDLAESVNRLQNQVSDNAITPAGDRQDASTEVMETETEDAQEESDSAIAGVDIPQKQLDWNELAKVNPDIYAWIYIPGTQVDYPVLQHPTDNTYYLNYNMNGTRGYPGCIYTEKENSKDFTDFNTVMYGHNMRNKTMFETLHYYEDKAFFVNNPYVYVYRGDRVLVYEIFAAYIAGNEHILYSYDFQTQDGRQNYVDQIEKGTSGNLRNDVEVTADSHILTLSTCISGKAKNRYLVQAVLLNEDDL
uniref:class B sortase n=1 Tax=Agathobacter sp. TaxID=2021311 RepID=UPI004024C756